MNILIITPLLPYPLNSGGAQAQYNMIDVLRHHHRITMVYPQNGNNTVSACAELKKQWPEVQFLHFSYASQLAHLPFFFSKIKRAFNLYMRSNTRSFKVERILSDYGYPLHSQFILFLQKVIQQVKPDIIQTEFYPYLPLITYLKGHFKTLFVHHEIRYIRNKRMMQELCPTLEEQQRIEKNKTKELALLNQYDGVITLTPIDKNILANDGVHNPLFVSPAAVNSSLLSYQEKPHHLCFLGSANHAPNVEGMQWFTNKVLPLISKDLQKKLTIHIIGANWNKTILPQQHETNIIFHGFVKDLSQVISGSMMIVPILSGSGMRMKILEAAALSLPVITTSVGVEGLLFKHNEDCLIANLPQEFADAIENLSQNKNLKQTLANHAQQVFSLNYSVEATANIRNNIYKTITLV